VAAVRKQHARYVDRKIAFLEKATKDGAGMNMNLVWDGDHDNTNAALTVFRHFERHRRERVRG
jgi:hypothetical protein